MHVAFLRGMNVGGHRLTNAELTAHFEALGFTGVTPFLASGNVVFQAGRKTRVGERIELGLREALGYDVPTFLRTAAEVREIAARQVFDATQLATRGKEQVMLLAKRPSAASRKTVLALATGDDLLAVQDRELHWLPSGGLLDSDLDFALLERTLGPTTTRTKNTISRLAAKHLTAS